MLERDVKRVAILSQGWQCIVQGQRQRATTFVNFKSNQTQQTCKVHRTMHKPFQRASGMQLAVPQTYLPKILVTSLVLTLAALGDETGK
jgi:hypothetical protein